MPRISAARQLGPGRSARSSSPWTRARNLPRTSGADILVAIQLRRERCDAVQGLRDGAAESTDNVDQRVERLLVTEQWLEYLPADEHQTLELPMRSGIGQPPLIASHLANGRRLRITSFMQSSQTFLHPVGRDARQPIYDGG